jgi:hypothetical protein
MIKLRVAGILLCFAGLCLADSEYKDRRARFTEVSTQRYPNYIGFAAGSFSVRGCRIKGGLISGLCSSRCSVV